MDKQSKKLELSKETLLQLDDQDLAGVIGGGCPGGGGDPYGGAGGYAGGNGGGDPAGNNAVSFVCASNQVAGGLLDIQACLALNSTICL